MQQGGQPRAQSLGRSVKPAGRCRTLVIRSSSGVGTTGCFDPLAADAVAASAVLDEAAPAAVPALATLAALPPRARSSPLLAPPSSAAAARLRFARAACAAAVVLGGALRGFESSLRKGKERSRASGRRSAGRCSQSWAETAGGYEGNALRCHEVVAFLSDGCLLADLDEKRRTEVPGGKSRRPGPTTGVSQPGARRSKIALPGPPAENYKRAACSSRTGTRRLSRVQARSQGRAVHHRKSLK